LGLNYHAQQILEVRRVDDFRRKLTFETTSTLLPSAMENHLTTLSSEIATVAANIETKEAKLEELYVASGGESTDRIVSLEKSLDALRAEKIILIASRDRFQHGIAVQSNQGTSTLSAPLDRLEGTSGRGHKARRFTSPLLPLLTSLA
jgi:hypothetical protein